MMKTVVFLVAFLFISANTCESKSKQQQAMAEVVKSENAVRTNLNILIDSCWNRGDSELLSTISTENFVRYLNGIRVASTQNEMQAHMNVFFTGFPDLELRLDHVHVEEDKVFLNWTATGTNTGVFGEINATGKKVKIGGLSHLYFNEDGKLYREDAVYNELELLQQLGYTLEPPVLE